MVRGKEPALLFAMLSTHFVRIFIVTGTRVGICQARVHASATSRQTGLQFRRAGLAFFGARATPR